MYGCGDRLVNQSSADATLNGLPYGFINRFKRLLLGFLLRHYAVPRWAACAAIGNCTGAHFHYRNAWRYSTAVFDRLRSQPARGFNGGSREPRLHRGAAKGCSMTKCSPLSPRSASLLCRFLYRSFRSFLSRGCSFFSDLFRDRLLRSLRCHDLLRGLFRRCLFGCPSRASFLCWLFDRCRLQNLAYRGHSSTNCCFDGPCHV